MNVITLAQKNIPDGWSQVIEGYVKRDHLLWHFDHKDFRDTSSFSSPVIGDLISNKYCVIAKEKEKAIKVRFKSLKKILKENPELLLTKNKNIMTIEQANARNGHVTLNSVWVENLGKDYTFHARTTLMEDLERFIEREYDNTHMLTWDRIDKTKDSWITVGELLEVENCKAAKEELEDLKDHISVIISKLHDYDRKSVNINEKIEIRDKLLEKKNHEIDSLQCALDMSRNGYEATIKDLRTQLGSIDSNSREAIMKRKFVRIVKT